MIVYDYSAFLTPEQLAAEERLWTAARLYERYIAGILRLQGEVGFSSVLEFGCGTGWVPMGLPDALGYGGIDANPYCLEYAQRKNPGREFILGDVRTWQPEVQAGLTCAFAFMKHFALPEWAAVLHALLRHGEYGLFTTPMAAVAYDDQPILQLAFPHVWVDEILLRDSVAAAGHEILWRDTDPIEPLIATRRLA